MKAVFVYVTAPSMEEARKIVDAVIVDRLAACANIIPSMTSVYHWKGEIAQSAETVVIFKTRDELFPALKQRVEELHSYKTPCIVALPVVAASAQYLQWIFDETKP